MPFGFSKTLQGTWFPHLHRHSDHSIKDGCASLETYAANVSEIGGDSLCATEHGHAGGYARQYFACRAKKIKPIYGVEAYVCEDRRHLERIRNGLEEVRKRVKKKVPGAREKLAQLEAFRDERLRPSRHAVLIARNRKGYQNLVRISSDSWINGYYYSNRTDTSFLAEHAEGIVYSTACIGGYIPVLARHDFPAAVIESRRLQGIFGHENFFVELMATAYNKQRETNEVMLRLAHEVGAPCIVTCDVHYAKPQDQKAQSALLLMRDGKTIKDAEAGEGAWQFETKDLYEKNLEQVIACWSEHHKDYWPKEDFQKALKNTYELAASIEDFDFDCKLKLPGVFPEPAYNLKQLVLKGLADRKARGHIPASGIPMRDYAERIVRELGVVNAKDFAEYFLILWDVCKFARESGARMGPGRGSAGGSLIAYLLGITDIDPLRHNLIFERFLDPTRKDAPDVDLDFSPEHREGIKAHIQKTYKAVATIGTYSTFRIRGALLDVGAVYGIERKDMHPITTSLSKEADKMELDQILEVWPVVGDWAKKFPEAWEVVKTLDGLVSHRGQHAAGVLIAPESALDDLPMIKDPKTGSILTAYADTAVQGEGTSYEGREISRLGYVKLDILGVDSLNSAPRAVEILERETGEKVDLESLPLDDPETLAVATTGDVPGAFQFDTETTRPLMRCVGVDTFEDLSAITALARPGPLKNELHLKFAKLKKGGDAWKADLPETIHADVAASRGLMIYQEDVMFTLRGLGGFSMPEANAIRKIMAKKLDTALLIPWREKFVAGGMALGHSRERLEAVFATLDSYCSYAFPKAHSTAYALTAYRQIYMLAHYPLHYFAGLIATTEKWERLASHMRSAMARGISVLPPSVLYSRSVADVEGQAIRCGLSQVKSVGGAAEAVLEVQAKASTPFSFEDFLAARDRRRANAKAVTTLILAGACDDMIFDEAGLEDLLEYRVEEPLSVRRALLVRSARFHWAFKKKPFERPALPTAREIAEMERKLVGLLLSLWSSPEPGKIREALGLQTIKAEVKRGAPRLHLLVEVSRCYVHKTAGGSSMAFLTFSDEAGTLDNVVLPPGTWKGHSAQLSAGKIAAVHLVRKEARDHRYGKWCYHLDDHTAEPVEPLAKIRRRLACV